MAISAQAKSVFAGQKGEGSPSAALEDARKRMEEERAAQYWDPALAAQERALGAARRYGTEAEQMRTAAQQQLGAGIEQTRADLMAGAGARGLSPSLGRAAGYAGGQLGQRGVTQARALQAQELAAAQAAEQQLLAQQAGLYGTMAEQRLGQEAAESQALQALQALAGQRAAQQQQLMGQYAAAGMGAGGAALGQLGGYLGGQQQQPSWTPQYQQQYQQWAQTYSDERLKTGLRKPGKLDQSRLLDALSGSGRQYSYTDSAQQQLGGSAPPGLHYGPMAQDLAQTKLGASAVVQTPAGLAVDTGRLGLISAGLIGQQEERLRKLEGRAKR